MRLDLPFDRLLSEHSSILIAGMGGGFDLFCGLPLYFELVRRGHTVHLASVSFAAMKEYEDGEWLSESLVGVKGAPQELSGYHPERFLSRWFKDDQGQDVTVWCLEPTGTLAMQANFRELSRRFAIDAIMLVDGGVDSLTRGDEDLVGTVLEDCVSLAAVAGLEEVPVRVMGSIGMGVEQDVWHGGVFENIAAITRSGGFLGVTALDARNPAYRLYEEAVFYAHRQPGQQPSVVNASIISSAQGHFGDYHLTGRTRGSELWISPLMSLYWFFNIDAVVAQNLFMPDLRKTNTAHEAFGAIYDTREQMTLRPSKPIPLT